MSQFAPTGVSVPAGFEELLEAVTREILREQPVDIVTFATEYFKRKVTLRDGNSPLDVLLSYYLVGRGMGRFAFVIAVYIFVSLCRLLKH